MLARALDHGKGRLSLVPPEIAERCRKEGTIPLLRDAHGRPLKRNFVHVDDLVDAILAALDNPATRGKLYNIAMDEPVDYAAVAAHLKATQGLGSIDVPSAYHSNWLDNARARFDLNWRPRYDLAKLIDAAWTYNRAPDDPRKVWYPG
jgi:UDP-glucose 4-epimerase